MTTIAAIAGQKNSPATGFFLSFLLFVLLARVSSLAC
jgi:hypothetical protein